MWRMIYKDFVLDRMDQLIYAGQSGPVSFRYEYAFSSVYYNSQRKDWGFERGYLNDTSSSLHNKKENNSKIEIVI